MKRYSRILFSMVLALMLLASCAPTNTGSVSPEKQDEIQNMSGYLDKLVAEGLTVHVQIFAEDGEPYIFIMRPVTGEITDEEIKAVGGLVTSAVSFFRASNELHEGEINIVFQRPQEHRIALIKRENALEVGGQPRGEISMIFNQSNVSSIINLAGPKKNGRQDYANAWSVIQAVCLAFAVDVADSDPVCNIISANAAAGWTGIEASEAEQIITAYGDTDLKDSGSQDYRYRFLPSIYDEFRAMQKNAQSQ